jgi:membrane-associated protein
MDIIISFIDFFVHLDKYLPVIIQRFGIWTYIVVFLIIFCETGLVVVPILPGDSLLFALGSIAALGAINLELLLIVLCIAAISGNMVNYTIGHFLGPKVFNYDNHCFFKKEYLVKTHRFYENHGGLTIIITRFIPIVRTFAPFVAGVGAMTYSKFTLYNIVGGIAWVCSFLLCGYYFGNIPVVKNNFTLVIFAIIIVSVMPGLIDCWRRRFFIIKDRG